MRPNKADLASSKAYTLDKETQELLASVRNKNTKALRWFVASWTILFIVGVAGIFYQNEIANANKQHIDCIVKLFTTPLPANDRARSIANPSTSCDIKFTK